MASLQLELSPHPSKTPSKPALYAKAAVHAENMIQVLAHLALHADNDSAKVAAAKTLLNKVIPDLKVMEIEGGETSVKILVLPTGVAEKYGVAYNTEPSSQKPEEIQGS